MNSLTEPVAPVAPQPESEAAPTPNVKNFEVVRPQLLVDFVDRMNRRAKKLGLPPLTIEIGKPVVKQQTVHKATVFEGVISYEPGAENTYGVEVFPVTVSVTPIKLPGPWQFAARIDHEEGGNIIASVPGMELPPHFRTADCACEHCKTKRNRAQTYVVRNVKEDRHVQVGTDCIRDFLGHDSPELIAQQLAFMANLTTIMSDLEGSDREYREGGGVGAGKYLDLSATLALVNSVVRQHGYVSGGKERDAAMAGDNNVVSTRRRVQSVLNDREQETKVKYAPTEEDKALSAKVITWAREELGVLPQMNDYQSNLVTVTGADSFNEKHLGIVASAPSAYSREMDHRYERERLTKETRHVGVVGERVDFSLTLRKSIPLEGDFGLSTICIFEDTEGNTVKWKRSGEAPCDPGAKILLKGTIKAHDNYKGVPQTVITRCKEITALKVLPTVVPKAPVAPATADASLSLSQTLSAPRVDEVPVPATPRVLAAAAPEVG